MNQPKRKVQRAFHGLVGLPPEPVEPVRRGRPKTHLTEADRKTADAARKRGKRVEVKAGEVIAAHPDSLGSVRGETSGGYGSTKIEKIVAAQQAAEASGLGSDRATDEYGGTTELTTPDRKRTGVPVDQDQAEPKNEREDVYIETGMRKSAAELARWKNWDKLKPRECPVKDKHAGIALRNRDESRKVYCGRCRKLLVKPGKWIVGEDGERVNFTDTKVVPITPLKS